MQEDKNLHDNEDLKDEFLDEEIEEISLDDVLLEEEPPKEKATEEVKEVKKKDNKKIRNTIGLILICTLFSGAGYMAGKDAGRKLPATHKKYSSSNVIATVGDSKITGEDMQAKMDPVFYLNGKIDMSEDQILTYEETMIDFMTTTEVLYLAGKEAGVEVTDEQVESEYTSFLMYMTQTFSMEEEDFLNQFGFTKEFIKSELEKELIAATYIGEESAVDEEEAKNYYENNKEDFLKVRASHILIQNIDEEGNEVSEEEKEENKKLAEDILARANNGEDFAALAKEYSEDGSAQNGGDLDYFGKGQMVEPFETATFELEVGEVTSELVETEYGYHIIKKTDEKYDEFDIIGEELQTKLVYEKQDTILQNLIEQYGVEVKES